VSNFRNALRGFELTAGIVAAVAIGLLWPDAILGWHAFDPRDKRVVLAVVQVVMFGMGTQMSLRDFAGLVRAPRGVIVGTLSHYIVMPLTGVALARAFHFPAEVAAGVVLIGSCSSGLASNVMAYLARANLALSVTITAMTTLVAPVATPLLMKLFAGSWVTVAFLPMVTEIIRIVVVPIGAAMYYDFLKGADPAGRRRALALALGLTAGLLALAATGSPSWGGRLIPPVSTFVEWVTLGAEAQVVGTAYFLLSRRFHRIDRLMPIASILGIIYFTLVTTAAGRDDLLRIGGLLFVAAVLHNALGYALGYGISRGCGLDRNSARAVAFEVGILNGGMATGLAGAMGKLATVGLASAVFSPWMNISGSLLANYWRRRPVGPTDHPPSPAPPSP
jgi:BASS family bile acid:Na+ symporter